MIQSSTFFLNVFKHSCYKLIHKEPDVLVVATW